MLASNLANADTPGFQARDLDFNTALQAALLPASRENVDALQAAASGATYARPGVQPSMDGNTVDTQREQATYAQAALEYRASMAFVESKVRTMLTAITGQ
ncbi:flagellar basal body rod protein FlgB [Thermomonas fusca]